MEHRKSLRAFALPRFRAFARVQVVVVRVVVMRLDVMEMEIVEHEMATATATATAIYSHDSGDRTTTETVMAMDSWLPDGHAERGCDCDSDSHDCGDRTTTATAMMMEA